MRTGRSGKMILFCCCAFALQKRKEDNFWLIEHNNFLENSKIIIHNSIIRLKGIGKSLMLKREGRVLWAAELFFRELFFQ